jgi:cobalt-zinc-cadmium efflux system protein
MSAHDHSHHDHGHEHPHSAEGASAHATQNAMPKAPAHEAAHAHSHGHSFSHGDHAHDRSQSATRLKWAFALTAGFMLAEVIGGWISGSLALIADAGHMLTDAASLGLAIYALKASARPADATRSYGFGRMQVLAAFVNGISLVALAVWICVEAALRVAHPSPVLAGPMLVIAVLGLVVNIISFFILHGGDKHDLNMQGAVAHVLGDLLGSIATIIAAVVILKTGWFPIDPLLSVLVAFLIVRTGLKITKQSAHILLQGAPEPIDLPALETGLCKAVPGLAGIHHVHLWSLTPQEKVITLHAELKPGAAADDVIAGVSAFLKKEKGVSHATIQVETQACDAMRAAHDHA